MGVSQQAPDLIDVIVSDHREVERVFVELEQGTVAPGRRKELVDHVIAELVRHSVAEEQYLYPAARRALSDGDRIADHEIEEHAEAERVMKELEGLEPGDARFEELVRMLISEVRHHIREEEQDLLPRLRQECSERELVDLGDKILRAKKLAPTRPHPAAPDTPPANKVLAPGAALVDRMRDALQGRGT